MPRLILLNGPPAAGKSTLARRYADDHPPALNLDVDRVRGLIGGRRDDPRSGRLARSIALAAARVHLTAGHDVVVPQFLGRVEFAERLEQLAAEVGVPFHEVVLLDDREVLLARFAERSRHTTEPEHAMPDEGPSALSTMYDRLLAVLAARPRATVVRVAGGGIDQAYQAFLRALA
ncbi:hypothetical protein SUDANB95_04580 [Actinosynnema sp. ALI-1.44]